VLILALLRFCPDIASCILSLSVFDNIGKSLQHAAEKALDEATQAADDISHGDIIGAFIQHT